VFTIIYSENSNFPRNFFLSRMSYDAVKVQHAEINRAFEERYDELSGILIAVRNGLKKLVAEHKLDEDDAVWALRSLDSRKYHHILILSGKG
jgi:hypothetical protein